MDEIPRLRLRGLKDSAGLKRQIHEQAPGAKVIDHRIIQGLRDTLA